MKTAQETNDWLVVYTMSNTEKRIAKELDKQGITHYLPLQKVIRQWSDRKKKVEVPLFPNYLFVNITKPNSYKVLMINGVVRYLKQEGDFCTLDDDQINAIKTILLGKPEVLTDEFIEGDRLIVTRGPLRGLEGVVTERLGRMRIAIRLEIMNRTLLAEVSPEDLEKIEPDVATVDQ